MLNHINIMGRVTKDIEVRTTPSGTPVCSFTLAVERDFKDANGNKATDFIDCIAWRGTAEFIGKYFSKGRVMVVGGRLHSRKWTDKSGQNRTSWEVDVSDVYFGDSRRDTSNTADEADATPGPQMREVEQDGELPF